MEDNSAVAAEPTTTEVGEEGTQNSTSCTPAETSHVKEDVPLLSAPGRDCLVSDGLEASSGHLAGAADSEAPNQHDTPVQQLRAGAQDLDTAGVQEPHEGLQTIDGQHLVVTKRRSQHQTTTAAHPKEALTWSTS
jgi:hypothetical protein